MFVGADISVRQPAIVHSPQKLYCVSMLSAQQAT
jgi:hypothetical protein